MHADALSALDAVRLAATSGGQHLNFGGVDADTRRLLRFAVTVGAPVAFAAELAHRRLIDHADVARAVSVASAEARMVALLLTVSPALLLPLTANVLQMPVLAFYTSNIGRVVFITAGVLYLAGSLTVRMFIRRLSAPVVAGTPQRHGWVLLLVLLAWVVAGLWTAVAVGAVVVLVLRRQSSDTYALNELGFAADLLVVAVSAGVSLPAALRHAADDVSNVSTALRTIAYALDAGVPPEVDATLASFSARLWQAHTAGAPTVRLIEQFSRQLRADERAERLARTARLPSQLTIPTTVMFLPATVLVMLAPVVAYGVSTFT